MESPQQRAQGRGAGFSRHPSRLATLVSRNGFTLIELMVVIAIIGLMFVTLMGAMYSALDMAKRARSQQVVAKLNNQIAGKWETYQTRRLPVNAANVASSNAQLKGMMTGSQARLAIARAKLGATRELMRLEMPDAYVDIGASTKYLVMSGGQTYVPRATYLYQWFMNQAPTRTTIGNGEPLMQEHDSPECLYMTLTLGAEDRDATSLAISVQETSDMDLDGMPEFRDGWGNPIYWIRWPSGFVSDVQPMYSIKPTDARYVGAPAQTADLNITGNYLTRDPPLNHDPFDMLEVDRWEPKPLTGGAWPWPWAGQPETGYNLMPLIFSCGSSFDPSTSTFPLAYQASLGAPAGNNNDPPFDLTNRSCPYYSYNDSVVGKLVRPGAPRDATANQVVHNQSLGSRQ
jgi:prepilin-type N-terminal cleavage/methylation domain-containing protein